MRFGIGFGFWVGVGVLGWVGVGVGVGVAVGCVGWGLGMAVKLASGLIAPGLGAEPVGAWGAATEFRRPTLHPQAVAGSFGNPHRALSDARAGLAPHFPQRHRVTLVCGF